MEYSIDDDGGACNWHVIKNLPHADDEWHDFVAVACDIEPQLDYAPQKD